MVDDYEILGIRWAMPRYQGMWPRPIPVSERLPEHQSIVLVFGQSRDTDPSDYMDGGEWHVTSYKWGDENGVPEDGFDGELVEWFNITHWLPLPPPPTEA